MELVDLESKCIVTFFHVAWYPLEFTVFSKALRSNPDRREIDIALKFQRLNVVYPWGWAPGDVSFHFNVDFTSEITVHSARRQTA